MLKALNFRIFIFATLMAYSPVKAVDWGNVGIGACIVGGISTVAALIWKACTPESNEHMLSRIQTAYDNTSCYMRYVKACEAYIHTSPYSLKENQLHTILHTALDNTLITALELEVEYILNVLASSKRELEQRIREQANSKPSETLKAMNTLLVEISEQQNRINTTLKALLDAHGTYFKATQYYETLATEYIHETSILNGYHYDRE